MRDTISIDHDDIDNKASFDGRTYSTSPALERTYAAAEVALKHLQDRVGDKRCIIRMRTYIKALRLTPDRLLRLTQDAHSVACWANRRPTQDQTPGHNCTNEHWSAAAWAVSRAAASVLVETVRPTSPSDFAHLLDVVQLMQGQLPLGPRAMRRFTRRMQIHLANILNGRRIDLGLLPPLNSVDLAKVEKAATYIPAPTGGNEATAVH